MLNNLDGLPQTCIGTGAVGAATATAGAPKRYFALFTG